MLWSWKVRPVLSKNVVPAELAEIGEIKFVKNLTYSKSTGKLISIVIFKRTEAAQRSIALDDLYIQGFQVRIKPAPIESALFESQLLNSFSMIQVVYDKFNIIFLPFLKMYFGQNALSTNSISSEISEKFFQYNKFCYGVLLEMILDQNQAGKDGSRKMARIKFQCPVFFRDKILYDLDRITDSTSDQTDYETNFILSNIKDTSQIIPSNVQITISDEDIWKKWSLVKQDNTIYGDIGRQVDLFEAFMKLPDPPMTKSQSDQSDDFGEFCGHKSGDASSDSFKSASSHVVKSYSKDYLREEYKKLSLKKASQKGDCVVMWFTCEFFYYHDAFFWFHSSLL